MSWEQKLYQVYETGIQQHQPLAILPIAHTVINAQIEITLDENGNFLTASTVKKENAKTVIPVTEASSTRTSAIIPMPLTDKLIYLAGDYSDYTDTDNTAYFTPYLRQLAEWNNSTYTHPAVRSIYTYLQKATLINDLLRTNVLHNKLETGQLSETILIGNVPQTKAFVRFIIQYRNNRTEPRTWLDTTLQNCFIQYEQTKFTKTQLCYATGKYLPAADKHPAKIRYASDKAKLFSANDNTNFTFRGRFENKEEAISISRDFSQKMHNALKWLTETKGHRYGELTLFTWTESLLDIPDITSLFPIEHAFRQRNPHTVSDHQNALLQYLQHYQNTLPDDANIMIMGLDSATKGRLSIAVYQEISKRSFLQKIRKWYTDTATHRYLDEQNVIASFSLNELIKGIYGTENNDILQCDETLAPSQILRLLPCILQEKPIPEDMVQTVFHKASMPLTYKMRYNHRLVTEVACSLINTNIIRTKKGEPVVKYDPSITDRNYLYGCLLAIADKAEYDTYTPEEKHTRVTNARRYWHNFSQHPFRTWKTIEESLVPYLNKSKYKNYIRTQIGNIMEKMTMQGFTDDTPLNTLYLLGYHQYINHMYTSKLERDETEDHNDTTQTQN